MVENRRRLAVFSKSPAPGTVKTRLIPDLGVEHATAVHRVLLEHVLGVCAGLEQVNPELWLTGLMDASLIAQHQQFELHQQRGSNLGERMLFAVEDGFERGDQVLLTGSDCAEISAAYIQQAFESLDSADLVIGPALDGGYVLIGQRAVHPELYTNIHWGTRRVLQQTLRAARALGLVVTMLEPQSDVDLIEDLLALETRAPELWQKLEHLIPDGILLANGLVACG